MPVLAHVQYPEGRDIKYVKRVLEMVNNALEEALEEKPENIRVTVKEIPQNRYSVGGVMSYDSK